MSLRDQFEAWCKTERNHSDLNRVKKYRSVPSSVADEYMNPVVELAWQAYQAGHAASGRDELLGVLQVVLNDLVCEGLPEHKIELAEKVLKKARGE
jgi:hypothetical protein